MTNGNDFVNMTEDCYKDNASGKLVYSYGLTKRELFAAMAMQSIISSGEVLTTYSVEHIANMATTQADALIAELNKGVQS